MTSYDDLISIGDAKYIFDLEIFSSSVKTNRENKIAVITTTEEKDEKGAVVGLVTVETEESDTGPEIDVSKFELLTSMFNTILLTELDDESELGAIHMFAKAPLGFKLSFNTLLSLGIIKEI